MSADSEAAAELVAREPLTHRLPGFAVRHTIEALFDPEFFEVGASGRRYERDHVVEVVERRYAAGVDPDDAAWRITDVSVLALAQSVYLVTYRLVFNGRVSRRVTVWRRCGDDWRAVYHQGTVESDS